MQTKLTEWVRRRPTRNNDTPDHDNTLAWTRRIWHLSMAATAFTVAYYSKVVSLSIFPETLSRDVMYVLAAVNLLLVFRVSSAGNRTYWLNFAGVVLGVLFVSSRASSFLELVINGDANNDSRPDLWGAVTERWLLGVSITYVHLVNIRRPWVR